MRIGKIALLFMLGLVFCVVGQTQAQAAQQKKIAVIKTGDIDQYNKAIEGFETFLKQSGVDYKLSVFDAKRDKSTGEKIIAGLKNQNMDLLFVLGSVASQVAVENVTDIPIVFGVVVNPVESGLIRSMSSSGKNVTGVTMNFSVEYQFKKIKEILPDKNMIGVLYNRDNTQGIINEAGQVGKKLNIPFSPVEVKSESTLPNDLKKITESNDVFLWAVPDRVVFTRESISFIILETLKNKIPFMGLSSAFVEAGALFALDWDFADMGQQSGELALKIFQGANPRDLPVEYPRKSYLHINLRTAKQIKVDISDKVLAEAIKVIQ